MQCYFYVNVVNTYFQHLTIIHCYSCLDVAYLKISRVVLVSSKNIQIIASDSWQYQSHASSFSVNYYSQLYQTVSRAQPVCWHCANSLWKADLSDISDNWWMKWAGENDPIIIETVYGILKSISIQ